MLVRLTKTLSVSPDVIVTRRNVRGKTSPIIKTFVFVNTITNLRFVRDLFLSITLLTFPTD